MPLHRTLLLAALGCAFSLLSPALPAQVSGTSPVLATPPAAAQGVNGHLDPAAATQAYLATLPSDKKAKSDAYFEGGYWLILWDFIVAAVIYLILLGTGLSASMRNRAARMTRSPTLQSVVYWVQYLIVVSILGALGTERITLNDNLLNRASLEEIEAVMGHEMGHYVLNHVYKLIMEFGILIVIGFAVVAWLFERLRVRYEASWKVQGIGDPAGLPLVALLFSAFFFVVTPISNTIVRTQEYEADVFGLGSARQPDGFAQIAIKLSEYRKLDPGPWEERIFFDHPSGRTRIFTAMRWKAENLPATTPSASSASGSP